MKPVSLKGIDLAFPTDNLVMTKLLPPMSEIPKDFERSKEGRAWCNAFDRLFFRGGTIYFKSEIAPGEAKPHIMACMRSFAPKHEHKRVGVAYLMSLWCDPKMLEG